MYAIRLDNGRGPNQYAREAGVLLTFRTERAAESYGAQHLDDPFEVIPWGATEAA